MHRILCRAAAAGVLAAGIGSRVTAQPTQGDSLRLSYAEAQRRATQSSPAFLAVRQNNAIAVGELRQARLWQANPQLEYELPGAADGTRPSRYEAAISQELELGGQRGLRADVARSGVRRTAEDVRNTARAVLAEVGEAYYTAWATTERLAIARAIRADDDRLLTAIRAQLAEGEISVLESRVAEIELARNRARLLETQQQARSARIALAVAIGLSGDVPIALSGDLPEPLVAARLDADSLNTVAMRQRPDVDAASAAILASETSVRLARRDVLPSIDLRALASREDPAGSAVVGVGVGFALPLWNRNQGLVDRGEAAVQQARYAAVALRARVRGEIASALLALVSATEQLEIYEREVRSPAREQQVLLETAYREGKFDLAAFLPVRQRLLDAELSFWDVWLAQRRALIALDAATAGSVATADYTLTSGSQQ